jgi:hypothetical protein
LRRRVPAPLGHGRDRNRQVILEIAWLFLDVRFSLFHASCELAAVHGGKDVIIPEERIPRVQLHRFSGFLETALEVEQAEIGDAEVAVSDRVARI